MSFSSSSTAERVRARTLSRPNRLSSCADIPEPSTRPTYDRPECLLATGPTTILIAGSDSAKRSALARELAQELPASTRFNHVRAAPELLERAPFSRLVMLTGDLDGLSTELTVSMLGRRYPELPVLAFGPGSDLPTTGVPDTGPPQARSWPGLRLIDA